MRHPDKITCIITILGCTLCTASLAAEQAAKPSTKTLQTAPFSYNYAQLSYVDLDADFDGLLIEGSHDVTPELAITASYMSTDKSGGLDYDVFTLGLLYHQSLELVPDSELVLQSEFIRAAMDKVRAGTARSNDDNGLRFSARIRYQLQNNLETFGGISYTSLYDNDLALMAGINLALNKQFSAIASIELSDTDMLLFGIRMHLK